MGYRRYISDITEEANSVTFALVVRTENNLITYGGGYVTLSKPVTEADLDAAVQQIVSLGNSAYPKKLSEADRAALRPIAQPTDEGKLRDIAYQKNKTDWPTLGQVRGR